MRETGGLGATVTGLIKLREQGEKHHRSIQGSTSGPGAKPCRCFGLPAWQPRQGLAAINLTIHSCRPGVLEPSADRRPTLRPPSFLITLAE